MRKACLFICVSGLFAPAATAQDDRQYQEWMRSMFPSIGAIRSASENGTAAAATKLADTFDQVATYWSTKKSPDAQGFAEAARDAARAIASGGDKASNLRKIQAQCNGCHAAHRAENDPDRAVKGGVFPAGWSVIPDRGTADQSVTFWRETCTALRWDRGEPSTTRSGRTRGTSNSRRG
jgi:hypothetical protein